MLKVKFIRYKNVVIADVLEQGEEIERGTFIFSHNDYLIASYTRPRLEKDTLYLRGTDIEEDDLLPIYYFFTEEEAIESIKGFTAVIEAYNDNLKSELMEQENDDLEITIAE